MCLVCRLAPLKALFPLRDPDSSVFFFGGEISFNPKKRWLKWKVFFFFRVLVSGVGESGLGGTWHLQTIGNRANFQGQTVSFWVFLLGRSCPNLDLVKGTKKVQKFPVFYPTWIWDMVFRTVAMISKYSCWISDAWKTIIHSFAQFFSDSHRPNT